MIEQVIDTLVTADSLAVSADSLVLAADSTLFMADSVVEVVAADLFGEASQLQIAGEVVDSAIGRSFDSTYGWVAILLMGLYMLWLYRRVLNSRRYVGEDPYSAVQSPTESVSHIYMGDHILSYIFVVVMVASLTCHLLFGGIYSWHSFWMVVVGWHLVALVTTGALWAASYLSYNESMFREIVELKSRYFARIAAWMVPISLVASVLSNNITAMYISGFQSIIILCGYIFASWRLFRAKKISNLNWISYLCGVELLPIVLLLTILTRSLVI